MRINYESLFLLAIPDDGAGSGTSTTTTSEPEEMMTISTKEYADLRAEMTRLKKEMESKARLEEESIKAKANKMVVDRLAEIKENQDVENLDVAKKIGEIQKKAELYNLKMNEKNLSLDQFQRDYLRLLADKFKIPYQINNDNRMLDTDIKNLESFVQQTNLYQTNYDSSSRRDDLVDNTILGKLARGEIKI